MNVHCYPVSAASKYVPLLFTGVADRYQPVYSEHSLSEAIRELETSGVAIVHLHWEEFVLRECRDDQQADAAASQFIDDLHAFHARGGTIFWTVHNARPHVIAYYDQFLRLRRTIATLARAILVHNTASIDVLSQQAAFDPARLHILPHPSYLDWYEDAATLHAGLHQPHNRRIQAFGWIRRQKGLGAMIDMLPVEFLQPRNIGIRISGHGEESKAVIAEQAHRPDVEWDVRHLPDTEAAALLRAAACVVLPYERVLTSGVALLAMSVGAMLVAVDIAQMRELLPAPSTRFLYQPGNAGALRAVIDDVLSLQPAERAAIIEANLAIARALHPRIIATRLAALYDAASRFD